MSNLPKPLTKYGHVTLLWLQIPKIFIFRLILYQVLGKVIKFGGIGSRTKKLQAKKQIGRVENTPPPVVIGSKKQIRNQFKTTRAKQRFFSKRTHNAWFNVLSTVLHDRVVSSTQKKIRAQDAVQCFSKCWKQPWSAQKQY